MQMEKVILSTMSFVWSRWLQAFRSYDIILFWAKLSEPNEEHLMEFLNFFFDAIDMKGGWRVDFHEKNYQKLWKIRKLTEGRKGSNLAPLESPWNFQKIKKKNHQIRCRDLGVMSVGKFANDHIPQNTVYRWREKACWWSARLRALP